MNLYYCTVHYIFFWFLIPLSPFLTRILSMLFSVVNLCLIQKTFVYRTGPECRKNILTFVYHAANPDKWSCIYVAWSLQIYDLQTSSRLSNKSWNPLCCKKFFLINYESIHIVYCNYNINKVFIYNTFEFFL